MILTIEIALGVYFAHILGVLTSVALQRVAARKQRQYKEEGMALLKKLEESLAAQEKKEAGNGGQYL